MKRRLDRLDGRSFDLVVIGGGIHGVCIARDAALRGLSVALVEKGDFGAATSHNSFKLVHGGLRYAQHLDLRRMVQSARELRTWLRIAPHHVRPLAFVVPAHGWALRGPGALGAALALHRMVLASVWRTTPPRQRIEPGRLLSRRECLELVPGLDPGSTTGGLLWYDGQLLDADRLLIDCLADASAAGAEVANYVAAVGLLHRKGRVAGARCRDMLTGNVLEIPARLVVNAAGPWAGCLVAAASGRPAERHAGPLSKGMNLVTRPIGPECAFGVPSRHPADAVVERGGRMFFVTPWHGRSVIGTSHRPFAGHPDDFGPDEADLLSFLDDINAALPAARLTREDVQYVYAGLTPAAEVKADSVVRRRRPSITDHEASDGLPGLITAIGVKYTTARHVAERVVDLASAKLGGRAGPCVTAQRGLADTAGPGNAAEAGWDAVVRRAVRSEMARTLGDVVFRRTRLAVLGEATLPLVERAADVAGAELGWDERQRESEIESVWATIRRHRGHGPERRSPASPTTVRIGGDGPLLIS